MTRRLSLTARHLAVIPPADGPLYDPAWRMLEDADLDRMAAEVIAEAQGPVRVFAYGSLIWNPDFEIAARRRAIAPGWHRDFSLPLDHFRATPDRPGLMLALTSGGQCEGVVLDMAPGAEATALRTLLRRELVAHELAANRRWIEVRTEHGPERVLTFYADPVDVPLAGLDVAQQAARLALAAGPAGSGAEYLLRTAEGLERHGIHDPYIWDLQDRVAREIERIWMADPARPLT